MEIRVREVFLKEMFFQPKAEDVTLLLGREGRSIILTSFCLLFEMFLMLVPIKY